MLFELFDGVNDELTKNLTIEEIIDILFPSQDIVNKILALKIKETVDPYGIGGVEITRIA